MNLRNLLTAICVFTVTATSTLGFAETLDQPKGPMLTVRGLVMFQLHDGNHLRIIAPDAPGHKATITFIMEDGQRRMLPLKGHNRISASGEGTQAGDVKLPELVRLKELYGNEIETLTKRLVDEVSIDWSAIRKVATAEVSVARYTFIRKDTGEEIDTFRPRNVAQSIQIELNSANGLNFIRTNSGIDMQNVRQILIEQIPKNMNALNAYEDHFHHYLHYIVRPASRQFDVEPRKVSGTSSHMPRVGNSFWIGADVLCDPVAID